jgi:serine/threonine protein kinase
MEVFSGVLHLKSFNYFHRDIKPDNMMVSNSCNLKLIDFGTIAHKTEEFKYFSTYRGSEFYMAPEIEERKYMYDPEMADVYSLGCFLFGMVTKCSLNDYALRKIRSGEAWGMIEYVISEDLQILIVSMLKHDPRERATMEQVLNSKWLQDYN